MKLLPAEPTFATLFTELAHLARRRQITPTAWRRRYSFYYRRRPRRLTTTRPKFQPWRSHFPAIRLLPSPPRYRLPSPPPI